MNREIKFRAWHNERMLYSHNNTINKSNSQNSWFFNTIKDADIIMQFTGLTDKNGKDVYDGDIVRIHNYKTDFKNGEPNIDWRVFEVKYNQYLWAFSNDVIYMPISHYDLNTLEPYDIEIIGNIYENPELLSNG